MKYILIISLLLSACAKPSDSNGPTAIAQTCGEKPFKSLWTNKADLTEKLDLTNVEFGKLKINSVGICFVYTKYEGDDCSGTITAYTIDKRDECIGYNFKVIYKKDTFGLEICENSTSCVGYN